MQHRDVGRIVPVAGPFVGALMFVVAGGCQTDGLSKALAPSADGPVAFTRKDWSFGHARGSELTTEHYILYTTCTSKPFVDAMPGFLETCWQTYARLLPSENRPDQRMKTYLFQTRWQWERFTEQFAPARAEIYKRIRSGGYSERGQTVSHYSSRRASLSVLAHEGLHQYLEVTRGRNIPAWLNEGLACYFEAFDLDPRTRRPVFRPETNSRRKAGLRESLLAGGLIPLEEILATHAGLEVQKRASHVRSYYAQEWSLVLFLMQPAWDAACSNDENAYHEGFLRLLRDAGSHTMERRASGFLAADADGGEMSYGEAVFRAYLTEDLETFDADYEAFLHELLGLES